MKINTTADFATTPFAVGTEYIETAGFSQVGVGGAIYRVVTQVQNVGTGGAVRKHTLGRTHFAINVGSSPRFAVLATKQYTIEQMGAIPYDSNADAVVGTDSSPACQAAFDYGRRIVAGEGYFRLGSEVNCYRLRGSTGDLPVVLRGESKLKTRMVATFARSVACESFFRFRAPEADIDAWTPGNSAIRCGGNPTIENIDFQIGGGSPAETSPPMSYDLGGCGEYNVKNVIHRGRRGPAMRASVSSNSQITNQTTYFCGAEFPWRSTAGYIFSIPKNGKVISVTRDPAYVPLHLDDGFFIENDEGHVLTLTAANGQSQAFVLGDRGPTNSNTEIAVEPAAVQAFTVGAVDPNGQPGQTVGSALFDDVYVSMAANTNVVTTSTVGRFSPAMVGMPVAIQNADVGGGILMSRFIAFNSSSSMQVAHTCVTGVTKVPFGTPNHIYDVDEAFGYSISDAISTDDLTIYDEHVEKPRGIGILFKDCSGVRMRECKIHGSGAYDERMLNHMWWDKAEVKFDGQLVSKSFGHPHLVYSVNQSGTCVFGQTDYTPFPWKRLIKMVSPGVGGFTVIDGSYHAMGNMPQEALLHFFDEDNYADQRILLRGFGSNPEAGGRLLNWFWSQVSRDKWSVTPDGRLSLGTSDAPPPGARLTLEGALKFKSPQAPSTAAWGALFLNANDGNQLYFRSLNGTTITRLS